MTDSARDPTSAASLAELCRQIQEEEARIRQGGGAKAIARQQEKGRLTARERIKLLVDPGAEVFEIVWAGWQM